MIIRIDKLFLFTGVPGYAVNSVASELPDPAVGGLAVDDWSPEVDTPLSTRFKAAWYWSPAVHKNFPTRFKDAVLTVLVAGSPSKDKDRVSTLPTLPEAVLLLIMSMVDRSSFHKVAQRVGTGKSTYACDVSTLQMFNDALASVHHHNHVSTAADGQDEAPNGTVGTP